MSRLLAVLTAACLAGAALAQSGQPRPSDGLTRADREVLRLQAALEADLDDPRALVHLVRLQALIDEVTDLSQLRAAFLQAAWKRRANGEVRAYARWCIAQVEWRRGRRPRTRRWMRTLGTVTQGVFIGPFDNEGGSGFDFAYPPELAEQEGVPPDPAVVYPGKEHDVRWRTLPAISPLGYVKLSTLVQPADEVVVYVRIIVESEEDVAAALRLGTPGATKVWLRGNLVYSDPAQHPPRFDQSAVPVKLKRGPNPILIKLTQREGPLGYFVRISDPSGERLKGISIGDAWTNPPQTTRTGRERGRTTHRPLETVLGLLAARARNSKNARVLADHARVLQERHAYDRKNRTALSVAQAALAASDANDPASATYPYLVASLEDDLNRRRLALEEALSRDPDKVSALFSLAKHHLSRGRVRAALPLLRKVAKLAPNDIQAGLTLADAEASAGFAEDGRRRTDALARQFPQSGALLEEQARHQRTLGRIGLAEKNLRVAMGLYPGDRSTRLALISVLLQRGDLDAAVRQLKHELAFDPGSVLGLLRLADLLSENGRPHAAEPFYDAALDLSPDDPSVSVRRGRHHLRHGRRSAALAEFDRALALAPQHAEISQLRRLLTEEADDFAVDYKRELRAVVEAARGHEPEGEDTWTLQELTVVQVHKNGLSSRIRQEIHLALTARGADELRVFRVPYTPGDQELQIQQARVLKADGTIVRARNESEESLSEPWYRLYYDRRARVLSLPDVQAGDAVEITWRLDDVARSNMFGDYFGDFTFLQGTTRARRVEYVLIGEGDRRFYFNDVNLPGLEHRVETRDDGQKILHWVAHDVPKIVPEPGMPGWSDVAAYLHVSTYEDWSDVAVWWWGLVRDQLVPTPALRDLAHSLVADIDPSDIAAKVTAIHNYVVSKTRYVALEFGIHGFKPYRVDQIHSRRFGDCKDKASLMYSFLESVGIESRLVILRMRHLGRIPPYPASLAVFNHAILYVPQLDLWLDGTAEFAGTGELPGNNRGAAVLIIDAHDPAASRFSYVPHPKAEANTSSTSVVFDLDESGDAHAVGNLTIKGTAAPSYRRAYQAPDKRRQLFESSWASTFPGARILEVGMAGLHNLEDAVRADFEVEVPRFAVSELGGQLTFTPFGSGRGYAERYAPLSRRTHDLTLQYPFATRFRYEVRLPEGWRIEDVPATIALDSPFGTFRLEYEQMEGAVVARGEMVLSEPRVPAEEYQAFRSFLGEVDRAVERRVRLVQ